MQEKLMPIISRILRGTFVPFLLAWGLPAFASAQENCQLPSPPRQAASNGNHGLFFFVYPRAVDGSYSGCQALWDEKGVQVIVLTFEQGSVIKFESTNPSNPSQKFSCKYELGHLAANEPKNCPEYGRVKTGLGPYPESDDLIVPSERDPRR